MLTFSVEETSDESSLVEVIDKAAKGIDAMIATEAEQPALAVG